MANLRLDLDMLRSICHQAENIGDSLSVANLNPDVEEHFAKEGVEFCEGFVSALMHIGSLMKDDEELAIEDDPLERFLGTLVRTAAVPARFVIREKSSN